MKYIVRYILPLAAIGLLACSGEEVIDNPDYDPITNTVKAEVGMSIGHIGDGSVTRMSDAVTQNDGKFRGIKKYWLYTADETQAEDEWSCMVGGSLLLPARDEAPKPIVRLVNNVSLFVDIDHFLFYGIPDGAAGTDASIDEKMQKGFTNAVLPASASSIYSTGDIEFQAVPIAPDYENDLEWKTPVERLEAYLTGIIRSDNWNVATNASLINLRETFAKPDHLNGGSASKVLATVQELYNAVYKVSLEAARVDQKTIANTIIANITNTTYVTTSGEGEDLKLDWVSSFKTDYENFPENLGLPQGAAQYEYKNIGTDAAPDWKFVYNTERTVNAEATDVKDYIFPCELYYMTYTPLKAFETSIDWPNSSRDWSFESWSGGGSRIAPSTRSVALVNNIQYGTAQLATYVRCSPATLNSKPVLYDNRKALVAEMDENKPIEYHDDIFQLMGVIIGGQPDKVGWNFLPVDDATFNYAVYDRNMTSVIYANEYNDKPSQASDYEDGFCGPNCTLVFDNGASGGETTIVNVCLEFLNNGEDFYGKDGLIKNGQKFYLVGKLNPQTNADNISFNDPAVFYPNKKKRVFIQDYVTKARFTINAGNAVVAGSLGKAYSTIPDLRTTSQELGLSVNLLWEKGLEFKDHPLGNK